MTEEQVIYKQDGLLDDASILYPDFPPLPDFPCMSSSSSSSLTPAAVKAITRSSSASSSCSAASWAVLKSDAEEEDVDKKNHQGTPPALSSNASMNITQAAAADMDVMENFGFMDLLDDSTDLFDLASIFNQDETPLQEVVMKSNNGDSNEDGASDDLAMVFLEWLKSNKETVSAEDLRRVKIKKSTIECAAKRLGGGKEAMKQLLKLILEWVQTNHLQKRHMKEPVSNNLPYQQYYQDPFQNPNPNLNLNCKPIPPPCFAQSSWIGQPSYIPDPATVVTGFPPAFGYMGDSFANGTSNINGSPMLETAPSKFALASHNYNSFPDNKIHSLTFTGYGNQYPYPYLLGHEEQRMMRMGFSATKEARKKRMAKQRQLSSSHHRHHNHHAARFGSDNCNPAAQGNPGNWMFWPNSTSCGPAAVSPVLPLQNYQRQAASDRRQANYFFH